jgi:hypothetical protein
VDGKFSDSMPSRVAAQNQSGGVVGMDADAIHALNGDNNMEQRSGNNEVIEGLVAAGGRLGRTYHAIDQTQKSSGSQRLGWHVPVGADDPWALERAKSGSGTFTDQLVGSVHAYAADEVQGHEMDPTSEHASGPSERDTMGAKIRDRARRRRGEPSAFAGQDRATS